MSRPPWLEFAAPPNVECSQANSYLMSTVAQRHNVEALPGGFFVFFVEGIWVRFAVLDDVGGYLADDGGTLTEGGCVFHGEGPSNNLRECRHTFWGEEDNGGYIFYPSGPLITAAFKRLSEFFDDMV